jgi:hypothetical protein
MRAAGPWLRTHKEEEEEEHLLPTKIGLLNLFRGIHGTIVHCYLASAPVNNTLPLSSVYQISPDIHCHLPEKSRSSTAENNGAPTSIPLSLGHAL